MTTPTLDAIEARLLLAVSDNFDLYLAEEWSNTDELYERAKSDVRHLLAIARAAEQMLDLVIVHGIEATIEVNLADVVALQKLLKGAPSASPR